MNCEYWISIACQEHLSVLILFYYKDLNCQKLLNNICRLRNFFLIVEPLLLIILFYKSPPIKSKKSKPVTSEKKANYWISLIGFSAIFCSLGLCVLKKKQVFSPEWIKQQKLKAVFSFANFFVILR